MAADEFIIFNKKYQAGFHSFITYGNGIPNTPLNTLINEEPLTILSIIGSNLGLGTSNPIVSLDTNRKDAYKLPSGTTTERPTGVQGYIRYNTESQQFEGFGAGNQWGSLGGVKSVAGDTYILAEYSAGNDDKALHFYTSNVEQMILNAYGNLGIGTLSPLRPLHVEEGALFMNGNIGIGTTIPRYTLDVNGDLNVPKIFTTDLSLSNLTVTGSYFLANDNQTIRNTLQITPLRITQQTTNSSTSNFKGVITGLYKAEPQTTEVYVNGYKMAYYSSSNKDYDVSYTLNNVAFESTFSVTLEETPAYGDIVDIIVWPQYLDPNGMLQPGYVLQNINYSFWRQYQNGCNLYYTDGNVGIGTQTTDIYKLKVQGATYLQTATASNANIDAILTVSDKIGIQTSLPLTSLDIRSTDAILLPRGTSAQRPSGLQGYIRYNTETTQFEGLGAADQWGSLGGVKSTDQQTYISAELTPGGNDGNLRFYNQNNLNMILNTQGNLGIGTNNPTEKLHVVGNILTTGTLTASNINVIGDFVTMNTVTSNTEQIVVTNEGTGPALKVTQTGNNSVAEFYDNETGVAMIITNNGNIGIGTATTEYRLHVEGTSYLNGIITTNNNNIDVGTGTVTATTFSGTATQVSQTLIRGSYLTGDNYNGSVATEWTVDATTTATANKIMARDIYGNIYAANVGIGTTVAREKLDVQGGNAILSGNLGIGTTKPNYTVDVKGDIHYNGDLYKSNRLQKSLSITNKLTTVIGWGSIPYGTYPIPSSTSNCIAIAAGAYHLLALKSDGGVIGWGYNFAGQATIPIAASNNCIAIAAGANHSLALKNDGNVIGWGFNTNGQATIPNTASNCIAISAGGSHSLALKNDGTVIGWGDNTYGQITIPNTASNCIAIAAGGNHSLALKNDGSVIAWGYNSDGQITIPNTASNCIAIAAGGTHSLALKSDGSVITWGRNKNGLGVVPLTASNCIAIAAGQFQSLALKSDGTVIQWGGTGPAVPITATNIVAIAIGASGEYSLALSANDTSYIYGSMGIGIANPRQRLDVIGNAIVGGNIGIGTTNPSKPLHVFGESILAGTITTNNNNINAGSGTITAAIFSGTATQVSQDLTRGTYLTGNNYNGSVATEWAVDATTTATANKIMARDIYGNIYAANVGIGTTVAREKLDIQGGHIIVSGNLGIGNTNPSVALSIGSGGADITSTLMFNSGDAATNTDKLYWTYIKVGSRIGHSAGWNVNHYAGQDGQPAAISNGNFHFFTGASPSSIERFTILNNGNIGIGSTQPVYRLDVAGNASFNGAITTNNNNINAGTGTITAALFSGTATQVSETLTRGNYLTGNNYNGSVATEWAVDATSTNTANKVVVRDASGNFSAGIITASLTGTATQVSENLTRGTYLTGNNYNGSVATEWAVDASSTNTANKVVVRDASGNFSAGIITASLSGTATQVSQDLTRGTYLTGNNYNGSVATEWAVDATSTNTANKVVVRDASGNFSAGTITASLSGTATQVSENLTCGTYLTGDNYNGSVNTTWAVDATTTATANKIVARDEYGNIYAANIGIGTTTPVVSLEIWSSNAVLLPKGTNAFRPTGVQGYIRYNTESQQFEGFGAGNQWGSLGGVKSVAGDTYILAEYTAGNDDKALHFYTSNVEQMILNAYGNLGIGTLSPLRPLHVEEGAVFVNGNVGMGTTIPRYTLDVFGDLQASKIYTDNMSLSNLTVTGSYFLANDNQSFRNTLQITPLRITTQTTNDYTSNFTGTVSGLYKALPETTEVYVNGYKMAYSSSNSKDYDVSYELNAISSQSIFNVTLLETPGYGDIIDIIIWPQYLDPNGLLQPGYVAQYIDVTYWGINILGPGSSNIYYTSGNVGIGTSSPREKLDIIGNSIITGNVGIGVLQPSEKLVVQGNTQIGKGLSGIYNQFDGGPFFKQSGWDATGSSHTIAFPDYCIAENSAGTLNIQVKSTTTNKLGNSTVSFLNASSANVELFNTVYHKTANLTTFTITASTNDIIVSTDSDCSIAWTSIGSC